MGRVLTLILFVSLILRAAYISAVPPELFGDEVDVGYQAMSLLHTGRDLYSQPFPLYIHSLSEWRAPLLIYATVPAIAVFSHTALAVRLPEIIFGSLAPIILFLLVYQLTKARHISLLAALVLAFMPWHIIYSRTAYEVVILLDLVMLGTVCFLKKNYVFSVLFFGLTPYTYSTAAVFTPVYFVGLMLIYRRRPSLVALILATCLSVPFLYMSLRGPAADRFSLLSVFNSRDVTDEVNRYRQQDAEPFSKAFHNKFETTSRLIVTNYVRAFSTEFLFVRGDPIFRQSLQIIGELLPITAPFLLLGLLWAVSRRQWLMLFWLALAPLPASLTADGGFHATRLFLMIPPLSLLIGAGLYSVLSIKPKLLIPVFSIIFGLYFAWTANYYLFLYPKLSWRWWQTGFRDTFYQLNLQTNSYSRVFINNTYEPSLIRFLFYSGYSPSRFHREFIVDKPIPDIAPGYDGFTFDNKYFFGSFSPIAAKDGLAKHLLPGSLYVISQREDVGGDWDWRKTPPDGIRVLYTSVNPYNEPIFYLITKKI